MATVAVWIVLTDIDGSEIDRRVVVDVNNLGEEVIDFVKHCEPEVGDTLTIRQEVIHGDQIEAAA